MTVTDTVSTATRRAHLRSDVALAARVLPTHYPLGTFIAVNPLAGLEAMPFEQAIRRAGDLYGMPATLAPNTFRELYRAGGRITDDDLDAAIIRRYPQSARPADAAARRARGPAGDIVEGRSAARARADRTRASLSDVR